jgi:hypothetical protein
MRKKTNLQDALLEFVSSSGRDFFDAWLNNHRQDELGYLDDTQDNPVANGIGCSMGAAR